MVLTKSLNAVTKDHQNIIIYLAFPKPFDKEPLQHMTVKCKSHGMGISINNWIAHGLTDRKQRAVLDWMI